MALAAFGREAERFSDLDDVALVRAEHHLNCPDCIARDAELNRLHVAHKTALDAIDRLMQLERESWPSYMRSEMAEVRKLRKQLEAQRDATRRALDGERT